MNKAFLKRLKILNNGQLLDKAQLFKIVNMTNSTKLFQNNYNTIMLELELRGLIRK